jgi:hypothetical protein
VLSNAAPTTSGPSSSAAAAPAPTPADVIDVYGGDVPASAAAGNDAANDKPEKKERKQAGPLPPSRVLPREQLIQASNIINPARFECSLRPPFRRWHI